MKLNTNLNLKMVITNTNQILVYVPNMMDTPNTAINVAIVGTRPVPGKPNVVQYIVEPYLQKVLVRGDGPQLIKLNPDNILGEVKGDVALNILFQYQRLFSEPSEWTELEQDYIAQTKSEQKVADEEEIKKSQTKVIKLEE